MWLLPVRGNVAITKGWMNELLMLVEDNRLSQPCETIHTKLDSQTHFPNMLQPIMTGPLLNISTNFSFNFQSILDNANEHSAVQAATRYLWSVNVRPVSRTYNTDHQHLPLFDHMTVS